MNEDEMVIDILTDRGVTVTVWMIIAGELLDPMLDEFLTDCPKRWEDVW